MKKEKAKNNVKRIELSRKEIRVNLEKLEQDLKRAYSSLKRVIPEAITDKKIKPFGNASHIILSKEHSGKKAIVIIKK